MIRTECCDVTFYEGTPDEFDKGLRISTQLDGFFASSQTKSLEDVKRSMAEYCKANAGNVIVEFRYGQRSLGFFASFLSRDNVVWYGEGYVGIKKQCAM